jgi:hypothetical protein
MRPPVTIAEVCGWDDCTHPWGDHPPKVDPAELQATVWPCDAPGCGCQDFARAGSVRQLGGDLDIVTHLGDVRAN